MQTRAIRATAPALLVVLPAALLGLIAAAFAALVLARPLSEGGVTLTLAGLTVYGFAAALLVRLGLRKIGQLEVLGLTDTLAGMPNRRALHQDFARSATNEDKALALLDLDGFKAVNDQYGHFVGDRVIKQCASLLREVCGSDGRAYRLGGDEFAILVTGPIAGNILEGICHTLIARLAGSLQVDERAMTLGASIGLSRSSARKPLRSSELLRRSDIAMYVSKTGGKNRCTWFSEQFDRDRDARQRLEEELRAAVRQDQFRLAYQPLVDAATGEITAVEALLRWQRPDGTAIGPNVFVPVAETSGLIGPIGLWVLRTACSDALGWDHITLSVNVSPVQLRSAEFPIALGQILEETGFPPARLELEITETYLVSDPVVANRNLDVIRRFGVGIALDDFGSGYASIGFLRKFRFEKLKLDRSMVVDASLDAGSMAMLASSVAVARAMDMAVTAEGVETQAQADMVRAAGCDQIQGWHYFKAIPAHEIAQQLDVRRRRAGEKHGYVG